MLGLPDDPGQAKDFVVDLFRKTFDPERDFFFVGTRLPVPDVQSRAVTINGEQWTEVLYAGTGYHQPIFHIDMFVSLTGRGQSGRYRVLVGSPAEADRLLGRSPLPQALSEIFDDVARELEAQGFDVIRNPLPLTYVDDPQARERFWYFATSNNCLVQIDDAEGEPRLAADIRPRGLERVGGDRRREPPSCGRSWASRSTSLPTSTSSPRISAPCTASRSTWLAAELSRARTPRVLRP